jgi:SAM-dependent methyltransferase
MVMTTEYDLLAETYDQEFGTTTVDLAFYVEEAERAEPPVLELACGTGRVTLPIARAGVRVVAVDSSTRMLAQARAKAAGEDLPVRWVEADMRDFRLEARFGLVIIPARSFLHLLDPADQVQALENVRAHLRPGGRLALNFFVPSLRIIAEHTTTAQQAMRFYSEFRTGDTGQRIVVWESRRYDVHRQRIHERLRYEALDDEGRVVEARYRELTLCYIWPREMEHLLARTGFEVEALYGTFDREPFTQGSGEQIWVARAG